jgi:hypothetical protein
MLPADDYVRNYKNSTLTLLRRVAKSLALYLLGRFDVALVNAVFGWGLDTLDGQNEAVKGLARIMKPGGMLMLGWNTDRSSDPTELPTIEQFFIPSQCPGFEGESRFPKLLMSTIFSCFATATRWRTNSEAHIAVRAIL